MSNKIKFVSGWFGAGDGSEYYGVSGHPSSGLGDYINALVTALREVPFRSPVEVHFNVQPSFSKRKKILFLLEHNYIRPQNFLLNPKKYAAIFGWDADLKIHENFFYTTYPHNYDVSAFSQSRNKRFVMVCSNRNILYGPEPRSLYNRRQEVITYFEKTNHDFNLFGSGWNAPFVPPGLRGQVARKFFPKSYHKGNRLLQNYRGLVADKSGLLRDTEFNFCYENIVGYNGYVSEKLWDALAAGCIPVYWPSSRASDLYVPSDVFVDAAKFDGVADLVNYLDDMSLKERWERQAYSLEVAEQMREKTSIEAYVEGIIRKVKSLGI